MATKDLIMDDSLITYNIKDRSGREFGQFSFDPSDMGILKRYNEVVKTFESMDFSFSDDDIAQNIEKYVEIENIVNEKFDYLFNTNISKSIFSITSPLTITPSGKLFLESALEAIGQAIENETGERVKKMNNRINKYTAKYHK